MKLRLDLSDVDFLFEINNYKASEIETEEDNGFCNVNFSIVGQYINYKIEGKEMFGHCEVEYIKETFRLLLSDEIKEDFKLDTIIPDFDFDIYPQRTIYSEPGKIEISGGSMERKMYVVFNVNFWCEGGMGGNTFSMRLNEDEIEAFYTYLQLITNEIEPYNERVKVYMQKGIIYV